MKKQHIKLREAEETQLQNLLKQGRLPARKFKRALALLELNRGRTFTETAQIVGVTKQTASTWAKKYREIGLACLEDKPIAGRPITINGDFAG